MVPEEDNKFVIDPRRTATIVSLVLFAIFGIIGGFFVCVAGGFIALSIVSLAVAVLLGFE